MKKILFFWLLWLSLGSFFSVIQAQEQWTLQPFEKSLGVDATDEAFFKDGKLIYANQKIYVNYGAYLSLDTVKESSLIRVCDFEQKTISQYALYAKLDSLNSISSIVKSKNQDTLYFTKTHQVTGQKPRRVYSLITTDDTFSFINEMTLDVPLFFGIILNSYFGKDGHLYLVGYNAPLTESYLAIVDLDKNQTIRIKKRIGTGYYHKVCPLNDTLNIMLTSNNPPYLYYLNEWGTAIDSVKYGSEYHSVGYGIEKIDSTIFFAGKHGYWKPPEIDLDIHVTYKHKIGTDEVTKIYADTLDKKWTVPGFNNIATIDSNYIYSSINRSPCFGGNYTCRSEMTIYAINAQGEKHWERTFGGEAGYFLWHLIATPDTGVLALCRRRSDLEREYQDDMYWIKFNKDGTQDFNYFDDFTVVGIDEPTIYDDNNLISLYPNPATTELYIRTNNLNLPLTALSIQLFDLQGRMILQQAIANDKVDISALSEGTYLYKIVDGNKKIWGQDKVVKVW